MAVDTLRRTFSVAWTRLESTAMTSTSIFTLRGRAFSPRQRYAVACVLEGRHGLKVNCEVDSAAGERTALLWNGREVASWINHPLALGASGQDLPLGWSIWERTEGMAVRLMLPGFVQAMEDESEPVSLPFDPVAATFHALTCWEEQHEKLALDAHGRPTTAGLPWRGEQGMARLGVHEVPMSEQHHWPWIEVMWHAILAGVTDMPVRRMSFQPTFDVDVAYKHLGRPRWKSLLLQARDVVLGRWSVVVERFQTLRGQKKDPYDTYGWIRDCHSEESVGWFVLAADRKPPHDIGLNPNLDALPALVEVLHRGRDVAGWHPSYAAVNDASVSRQEQQRFESWGLWQREGDSHPFSQGNARYVVARGRGVGHRVRCLSGVVKRCGLPDWIQSAFFGLRPPHGGRIALGGSAPCGDGHRHARGTGMVCPRRPSALGGHDGGGPGSRRNMDVVLAQHLGQRGGGMAGVAGNIPSHGGGGPVEGRGRNLGTWKPRNLPCGTSFFGDWRRCSNLWSPRPP